MLTAFPLLLLDFDLGAGRITVHGFVLWAGAILAGLALYELVRNLKERSGEGMEFAGRHGAV